MRSENHTRSSAARVGLCFWGPVGARHLDTLKCARRDHRPNVTRTGNAAVERPLARPALPIVSGPWAINRCTVRLLIAQAPPVIRSASRANGEATAKRQVAHGGAPNAGYIRPVRCAHLRHFSMTRNERAKLHGVGGPRGPRTLRRQPNHECVRVAVRHAASRVAF